MNLVFDNDYQKRVMRMRFDAPTRIDTVNDVRKWRQLWTNGLKSWHSPYKALIDCSQLSIHDTPEIREELARMEKFLTGFFLKSAVGFGYEEGKGLEALFFKTHVAEEDAAEEVGLGRTRAPREPGDFRSSVVLTNYFQQHVMEMAFAVPVVIDSAAQWDVIRSKIINNLSQWHSKWSLLIDCANLEIHGDFTADFQKLERYLRGFFMKKVLAYSPKGPKETYPFEVYRSRHNAVARLESEGDFSGDEADCLSRKG